MNSKTPTPIIATADEFCAMDLGPRPGIEHRRPGDRWGEWTLRANLVLDYKAHTQDEYEVDLEEISTRVNAFESIAHLHGKGFSSQDVGDFVSALLCCIPWRRLLLDETAGYQIRLDCPWRIEFLAASDDA